MMKRNKKENYTSSEKWVECLNCSQEYVIEIIIDEKGCPICGSFAYEESSPNKKNWRE